MGTDIHLYTEVRVAGRWEWRDLRWQSDPGQPYSYQTHAELYGDRCYDLFAILADVRNGYGFAGVDTGNGFVPIAPPRGLPSDLSPELAAHLRDSIEHTPSYHTLAQLLAYDWTQVAIKRGVVDAVEFDRWAQWDRAHGDGPERWSGSVSGGKTRNVDIATMERVIADATAGLDRWGPE